MKLWLPVLTGLALAAGALATAVMSQPAPAPPPAQTPAAQGEVDRGHYLVTLGDCAACHTKPGGAAFAGGLPIQTPFGTLLTANITPDKSGIGDWTPDQFYRALHTGVDDEGKHLYPAFPYNYYTRVTRPDSDAIFAYLRTLRPVDYDPARNQLPFPLNIRGLMGVWNWLFFKPGEFKPDPAKSAEWNRGAYLVEALGHCGACHTPSNMFGAPRQQQHLQGGAFGQWFAPDLSANTRKGLGSWSREDLIEFLKTGGNAHASASAEMGLVVADSTSQMTDADLGAIATYLTGQPASPPARAASVSPAVMRQGQAIFVDACSACHRMRGDGVPRFFPPLKGDANLQQSDPKTVLHFILTGVKTTPTAARPTGLAMPAYAWKLNDDQIAAVASYIRNAWGNAAPEVTAGQVASLRRKLVAPGSQTAPAEHAGPLTRPGPSTLGPSGTDSRDNGTANAGRAVH